MTSPSPAAHNTNNNNNPITNLQTRILLKASLTFTITFLGLYILRSYCYLEMYVFTFQICTPESKPPSPPTSLSRHIAEDQNPHR
jgi:hypothetical protein